MNQQFKSKINRKTLVVNTKMHSMSAAPYFSQCETTPLPVTKKHGKEVPVSGFGFNECEMINTLVAADMVNNREEYIKIFGEQIAQTVVQYFDKNGNVVLTIGPRGCYPEPSNEKFASAILSLNHASRKAARRDNNRRTDAIKAANSGVQR